MGSRALYRKSEAMQPVRQRRSELPYVPEVRSADSQSAPRANIAFPPFDQISVFPTKVPGCSASAQTASGRDPLKRRPIAWRPM